MDYVPGEPLDVTTATEVIQGIAKFGSIEYSKHCQYERMPDRAFSFQDLQAILSEGKVYEPPKPNEKTGNLNYRVIGEIIDGDAATVIVEIVDHRSLCVITVFGG
jgi:hypothetical protein